MTDINTLRRLALDGDLHAIQELLDRLDRAEKDREGLFNALVMLNKMAEVFPTEAKP